MPVLHRLCTPRAHAIWHLLQKAYELWRYLTHSVTMNNHLLYQGGHECYLAKTVWEPWQHSLLPHFNSAYSSEGACCFTCAWWYIGSCPPFCSILESQLSVMLRHCECSEPQMLIWVIRQCFFLIVIGVSYFSWDKCASMCNSVSKSTSQHCVQVWQKVC